MRPEQWQRRAGRSAVRQQPVGKRLLIPDLFRNELDPDGELLERAHVERNIAASRELIVTALAGQKRPRPSDAPPVE